MIHIQQPFLFCTLKQNKWLPIHHLPECTYSLFYWFSKYTSLYSLLLWLMIHVCVLAYSQYGFYIIAIFSHPFHRYLIKNVNRRVHSNQETLIQLSSALLACSPYWINQKSYIIAYLFWKAEMITSSMKYHISNKLQDCSIGVVIVQEKTATAWVDHGLWSSLWSCLCTTLCWTVVIEKVSVGENNGEVLDNYLKLRAFCMSKIPKLNAWKSGRRWNNRNT